MELLRREGLDASAHLSRCTTAPMLDGADLILAMTAEHVRRATLISPESFGRTFLIKELAPAAAGRPRKPDETLGHYLPDLFPDREKAHYLSVRSELEVADPYGRRMKAYKVAFAELAEMMKQLVVGLFAGQASPGPSVPPSTTASPSATISNPGPRAG